MSIIGKHFSSKALIRIGILFISRVYANGRPTIYPVWHTMCAAYLTESYISLAQYFCSVGNRKSFTNPGYSESLVVGVRGSILDCVDVEEEEDVTEYDEDEDVEGGVLFSNQFSNLSVVMFVLVADDGRFGISIMVLVFSEGDDIWMGVEDVIFGV